MSSRCMSAVFERYPGAGNDFALALALADNAHDDGSHIFPGVPLLMHKARQSERDVRRHLAGMLESGWLILVRRGVGRGRPTEYRISADWLKGANLAPFPPVDNSGPEAVKGANGDIERVPNLTRKGAKSDTTIRRQLIREERDARAPAALTARSVVADFQNAETESGIGAGIGDSRPATPTPSAPNSKNRQRTPGATLLPRDWRPTSSDIERLANELSWPSADIAGRYAEAFRDIALAKGYLYRDWHAAFRNCARQDWPGFRSGGARPAYRSGQAGQAGQAAASDEAMRTQRMLAERTANTHSAPPMVRAKIAQIIGAMRQQPEAVPCN